MHYPHDCRFRQLAKLDNFYLSQCFAKIFFHFTYFLFSTRFYTNTLISHIQLCYTCTILTLPVLLALFSMQLGRLPKNIHKWKPALKYLHVCTLWTDIAKPFILHTGFIEIGVKHTRSLRTLFRFTPVMVICSNLDIISAREYCQLINIFVFSSAFRMECRDFYSNVYLHLQPHLCPWSDVHTIKIEMHPHYEKDDPDFNFALLSTDYSFEFINILFSYIPNVIKLDITEPPTEDSMVSTNLVNKYMSQLTYLYLSTLVEFSTNYFYSNIKYLHIHLSTYNKSIFLPHLRAAPLQYLSLDNVPSQFSWAEFYENDSSNITFTCLEVLDLKFIESKHDGDHVQFTNTGVVRRPLVFKLHFPKIHTLCIDNCPSNSELLYCSQYFDNLKSLSIEGSLKCVSLAINMGFQRQESLQVEIRDGSTTDNRLFYATTNYLFDQQTTSRSVHLRLYLDIPHDSTLHIKWNNLTHLSLYSQIEFGALINLISILPNLTHLMVYDLLIHSLEQNNNIVCKSNADTLYKKPTFPEWTALPFNLISRRTTLKKHDIPLNEIPHISSKLNTVCIYFSTDSDVFNHNAFSIIIFALAFSSLQKIRIHPDYRSVVSRNIIMYKDTYPHINGIKFGYASYPGNFNIYHREF